MNRHVYRVKVVTSLYRHLLLNRNLSDCFAEDFRNDDNEFFKTLRDDLLAHKDTYIAAIEPLLNKWEFSRLSYMDQAILLLAASEIKTGINDKRIAIDEAIRIAKEYSDEDSYKYINGVLDQL